MRRALVAAVMTCWGVIALAQQTPAALQEVARYNAPEARQAVAVDAQHFYAISDRAIGQYDKWTGKLVTRWEGAKDGAIVHLDSGAVIDGKLYAAYSNYPAGSVLEHLATIPMAINGQGIAWDRSDRGVLWGISRSNSQVVAARLVERSKA